MKLSVSIQLSSLGEGHFTTWEGAFVGVLSRVDVHMVNKVLPQFEASSAHRALYTASRVVSCLMSPETVGFCIFFIAARLLAFVDPPPGEFGLADAYVVREGFV